MGAEQGLPTLRAFGRVLSTQGHLGHGDLAGDTGNAGGEQGDAAACGDKDRTSSMGPGWKSKDPKDPHGPGDLSPLGTLHPWKPLHPWEPQCPGNSSPLRDPSLLGTPLLWGSFIPLGTPHPLRPLHPWGPHQTGDPSPQGTPLPFGTPRFWGPFTPGDPTALWDPSALWTQLPKGPPCLGDPSPPGDPSPFRDLSPLHPFTPGDPRALETLTQPPLSHRSPLPPAATSPPSR